MIPAPVVAVETELSRAALSCAGQDQTVFEENLATFIQRAGELRTYYGSRTWRNIRFTRSSWTRKKVAKAVNLIAPDPRAVVVFGAGFSGRSQTKGDKKGPVAVASIRAALASRRVVVMVDEYNTTACHLTCGTKMVEDEDDPHEKVCPRCEIKVDRDGNAAENIHLVWTSHITTGTRPSHLRRP